MSVTIATHDDHVTVAGLSQKQGNVFVGAMIRACQRERRRFDVEEFARVARMLLRGSEIPVRDAGGTP